MVSEYLNCKFDGCLFSLIGITSVAKKIGECHPPLEFPYGLELKPAMLYLRSRISDQIYEHLKLYTVINKPSLYREKLRNTNNQVT